ncbi:hypothetical protein PG990_006670 [Apiospora arundinis]|uniref:Uncharacterized protein n=1 Tax=Apiospora arundinis TaxID=335852 RepID=A0ABR2JB37_9PEZI
MEFALELERTIGYFLAKILGGQVLHDGGRALCLNDGIQMPVGWLASIAKWMVKRYGRPTVSVSLT